MPSSMDVYDYITLSFNEPVTRVDTPLSRKKVDSLWKGHPDFDLARDSADLKHYQLTLCGGSRTSRYSFEVDWPP